MPLTLTRSLLTILLPGFVATAPWLLLLITRNEQFDHWYRGHQFAFHATAFSLVVIVGSVFEEIGNYVELKWDRKKSKGPEPAIDDDLVSRDWKKYLSSSYGSSEPVGYRYLSRKVTALYFELGMMCAIPAALVGMTVLIKDMSHYGAAAVGVVAALSFLTFRKSAKDTHTVLCEARHFLMQTS